MVVPVAPASNKTGGGDVAGEWIGVLSLVGLVELVFFFLNICLRLSANDEVTVI